MHLGNDQTENCLIILTTYSHDSQLIQNQEYELNFQNFAVFALGCTKSEKSKKKNFQIQCFQ